MVGYIVGKFLTNPRKNLRVFWKNYPLGKVKSFFSSISKVAQWVSFDQSGEQFLKKLEIYPMGIVWVN